MPLENAQLKFKSHLSAGPPGRIWVTVRGRHFILLGHDPPLMVKPNVLQSASSAIVCCLQRTEKVSVGPEINVKQK